MHRKILGSLTAVLMLLPFTASALFLGANADGAIVISSKGGIEVAGATVTNVAGSVIQATTNLGSVVLNWSLNTDSSTKISGSGNATTSASLKTGDNVSFSGSLTSIGSSWNVTAKAIHDFSLKA